MKILASLSEVEKLSNNYQRKKKTVGLVVGSFDVLHMGHLNLFRCAKKHADILIVGLDNDKTITNTKGKNRPINNYRRRSQFLTDLSTIDYIFRINKVFKHGDKESFIYFTRLLNKIKPTHIFTHVPSDGLWKEKKELAKSTGVKFIPDKSKFVTHSSVILKKLQSEI